MSSPSASTRTSRSRSRADRIDYLAANLLPRAALLTRLLIKRAPGEISRADAGLLSTLSRGPRRITELAALEGLTQPTMTAHVKRLEGLGWVERHADSDDGRVVLVALSDSGSETLEQFRAQWRAILREHLGEISDEEALALERATEALGDLIDSLQQSDPA